MPNKLPAAPLSEHADHNQAVDSPAPPGNTYTTGDIKDSVVVIGDGAISTVIQALDAPHDVRKLRDSNPYRGLLAFGYADQASYAGRKRVIAEMVKMMTVRDQERPLLFITGASGSGKSSLARAGLLPALEKHYAALQYTPISGGWSAEKFRLVLYLIARFNTSDSSDYLTRSAPNQADHVG